MSRYILVVAAVLALPVSDAAGQNPNDSTGYTPRSIYRAGVYSFPVKRAVSVGEQGPVATSSATMSGAELWYVEGGGSALVVRYQTGTLNGATTSPASGKLETLDGRFVLGSSKFAFIAGYNMRTFRYAGEDRRFHMPRAGFQAGYHFPGSGVVLRVAGTYVRTVKKAEVDSVEADGIEGESSIVYVPPKVPLYIELGYRRDLFNMRKDGNVFRREEMGGVILGIGLQYGLSTR